MLSSTTCTTKQYIEVKKVKNKVGQYTNQQFFTCLTKVLFKHYQNGLDPKQPLFATHCPVPR